MTFYIAPVVEGHSEQDCAAPLLHAVWGKLLQPPDPLVVVEPSRSKRDLLIQPSGQELRKVVEKAGIKLVSKAWRDKTARMLL